MATVDDTRIYILAGKPGIAENRAAMPAPVCWAVGALFDYVAGVEPCMPRWMNDLALEWLWRLLIDPLGKWRRYIIGTPVII